MSGSEGARLLTRQILRHHATRIDTGAKRAIALTWGPSPGGLSAATLSRRRERGLVGAVAQAIVVVRCAQRSATRRAALRLRSGPGRSPSAVEGCAQIQLRTTMMDFSESRDPWTVAGLIILGVLTLMVVLLYRAAPQSVRVASTESWLSARLNAVAPHIALARDRIE